MDINEFKPYNFTETISYFDVINQDYTVKNIQEYINEDTDNIVIAYRVNNQNKYFLTTRSRIQHYILDLLVYPCPTADSMQGFRRDIHLINLRKLGIDYSNQYCDIRRVCELHWPTATLVDAQMFAIEDTNKWYPAFVSDKVVNQEEDYLSALHCQRGHESNISKLVVSGQHAYDLENYKKITLYLIFLLLVFLQIMLPRSVGGNIISKTTHSRGKTKSKSKRTSVMSRNDNRSLISSIKMMIMAVIDNNNIGRQKKYSERLKNILEKNGVDVKGIETSSNRFWSNRPPLPTQMNQNQMNLLIKSVEREHEALDRPPLETLKTIIHELVKATDEILRNKDGVMQFNKSVKKDFTGYTPTSKVTQHKLDRKENQKLTGWKKTRKYKKKSMKPKKTIIKF